LRLVILFALRYQKTQAANVATLINLMLANGVKPEDARVCSFSSSSVASITFLQLVYVILNTCGADQRQEDIFSNSSLLAKGRSVLKGIKVSFLVFQI
jgi:hypothetical protein